MTDEFPSIEAFSNFVKRWLPHLQPVPAKHYVRHAPADIKGHVFFYKQTLEAKALKADKKIDL